jgi:hypothetical protein
MGATATQTARDLVVAAATGDRDAFTSAWGALVVEPTADDPTNLVPAAYRDVCIALLAQVHGLVGAVAEHLGVTTAQFLAAVDASRPPRTNGSHA